MIFSKENTESVFKKPEEPEFVFRGMTTREKTELIEAIPEVDESESPM